MKSEGQNENVRQQRRMFQQQSLMVFESEPGKLSHIYCSDKCLCSRKHAKVFLIFDLFAAIDFSEQNTEVAQARINICSLNFY